jgi:uncharacterized protein (DUF1684 family)
VIDPGAHRSVVEAWREARYRALRRDQGWLTLAGLGWLSPGSNRLGTDPSADVVLPAGPREAGVIAVGDDGVVARGTWLHEGDRVDDLPLLTDAGGEPTLLELGDLRLCVIERGGRLAVRTWDLASPRRRDFAGIDHFPVEARWRLDARFVPTPGRTISVPDVLGTVEPKPSPGQVTFDLDGHELRLEALLGEGGSALWLVFGDATNGTETYAGGRFVYADAPEGESVVVDFNRAYNPPCVFSPFATCPLPWEANRLPVRIEAGERFPIA